MCRFKGPAGKSCYLKGIHVEAKHQMGAGHGFIVVVGIQGSGGIISFIEGHAESSLGFSVANIAVVVGYNQASVEGEFSPDGHRFHPFTVHFDVAIIVFDGLIIAQSSIGFNIQITQATSSFFECLVKDVFATQAIRIQTNVIAGDRHPKVFSQALEFHHIDQSDGSTV